MLYPLASEELSLSSSLEGGTSPTDSGQDRTVPKSASRTSRTVIHFEESEVCTYLIIVFQ